MRILNVGSINLDVVFGVPHIARPGETLAAGSVRRVAGGKGANQSVALARAGATVVHCGRVGPEGAWIVDELRASGVDVGPIVVDPVSRTGTAFIQVADDGENTIVLDAGANHELTAAQVDDALGRLAPGDALLLQNETNDVPRAIEAAAARGILVAFNPAPMTPAVSGYPLDRVGLLIVNETEAGALTGTADPEAALDRLPGRERVVTLGARGAIYAGPAGRLAVPAPPAARVVDTTAAGDTFIGYLLAGRAAGLSIEAALALACAAASVCVTRAGAIPSIPRAAELTAS